MARLNFPRVTEVLMGQTLLEIIEHRKGIENFVPAPTALACLSILDSKLQQQNRQAVVE